MIRNASRLAATSVALFMLAMFIWLFVRCGGQVELSSETSQLLECGALPDLSECRESDPKSYGDPDDLAWVCYGWPENPFGETDASEFLQVIRESGSRGIKSTVNGESLCVDRWK